MSNFWQKQPSSRILLSQATAITSGTTSQSLSAFSSQTRQIRVASTLSCWIRIGDGAQTAVAGDIFIPANAPGEYFTVSPGQTLAFISTSTSSGFFSASEMA